MDQPTAEHALRQLEPLVGEWTFEAKWLAESRGGAAEGSPSSDTPRGGTPAPACDGGAPEAPDNVSIIGCDPANGTYFQVYSDERGVCRIYEMSIGDGRWKLWRDGEPFPQRFTATISDDGTTITGRWEKAEDGTNYTTDFDLTYRRV